MDHEKPRKARAAKVSLKNFIALEYDIEPNDVEFIDAVGAMLTCAESVGQALQMAPFLARIIYGYAKATKIPEEKLERAFHYMMDESFKKAKA